MGVHGLQYAAPAVMCGDTLALTRVTTATRIGSQLIITLYVHRSAIDEQCCAAMQMRAGCAGIASIMQSTPRTVASFTGTGLVDYNSHAANDVVSMPWTPAGGYKWRAFELS